MITDLTIPTIPYVDSAKEFDIWYKHHRAISNNVRVRAATLIKDQFAFSVCDFVRTSVIQRVSDYTRCCDSIEIEISRKT